MQRNLAVGPLVGIYAKLCQAWQSQNSLVCVGLDPEMARLPEAFSERKTPFFDFCREIVDATAPFVCAFKPQFAHFAAGGRENELEGLLSYIGETYPHIVTVLDAKRGDIGSTAAFYAAEAFDRYNADAVTLSPYLGYESVAPYLEYAERGVIILCRTSNPDSNWLQNDPQDSEPVFARVARRVADWNAQNQCMLVAGATYPAELGRIRALVGQMPLLVPGIGAQGGDLQAVLAHGLDDNKTGLLISSSRGILYAGAENGNRVADDFAAKSAAAAAALRDEINRMRG